MLERDYLVGMLLRFDEAIRLSWTKANDSRDPKGAAELLEFAIGQAIGLDIDALLSLAPASMVSVIKISGTDPHIAEYVARSLLLESEYLADANAACATLRDAQARALASAYEIELPLSCEEIVRACDDVIS